jgi:hypothetical protein
MARIFSAKRRSSGWMMHTPHPHLQVSSFSEKCLLEDTSFLLSFRKVHEKSAGDPKLSGG